MRIRRIVAVLAGAALAVGTFGVAPAGAEHCSGKAAPPADYERRGTRTAVLGWTVQHGSANDPFVGGYYADGYVYADGSNADSDGVQVRAFIPFWPEYLDLNLWIGPKAADSCADYNLEVPEDWIPPVPV